MEGLAALVGALIGATIPHFIVGYLAHRNRLVDAYTAFAGAAGALSQKSLANVFRKVNVDPEWIQFHTCRANLWLLEKRTKQRSQIVQLTDHMEKLFSLTISLADDVDPEKERVAQVVEHGEKQKSAQSDIEKLLDMFAR